MNVHLIHHLGTIFQRDIESVHDVIDAIREELTEEGRKIVMKAAMLVALADGEVATKGG